MESKYVENVVVEPRSDGSDVSSNAVLATSPGQLPAGLETADISPLEKKLKRKIDLRLMPALVVMYTLNNIDRYAPTNRQSLGRSEEIDEAYRYAIAAAKLAGIESALGLSSTDYQTAVSVLYIGYLLMQVPSNMLLKKTGRPSIYLPSCMIIWGIISASTAACVNVSGLLAVRFFLGFVEAAYYPGCLYLLSCWYTRKEVGLRCAVLFSGAMLAGAFSGLMSAGIVANLDGARGIESWQWLFIIEGVLTISLALIAVAVLPDFPETTSWLTEEERRLAVWRLERDAGDGVSDEKAQTAWAGVTAAVKDKKTYLLLALVFSIVSSGTISNFFPAVVSTLRYDSVTTLLLTSPPYILAVCSTCINAWHSDKTRERYLHIVIPIATTLVAFIVAATTTSLVLRYIAMLVMIPSVYAGYVVSIAWITTTLCHPAGKRAAAFGLINAASNVSAVYASYLYPNDAAPRYRTAFIVNSCTACLAIVAATILRSVLVRLNKKCGAREGVAGAAESQARQDGSESYGFLV